MNYYYLAAYLDRPDRHHPGYYRLWVFGFLLSLTLVNISQAQTIRRSHEQHGRSVLDFAGTTNSLISCAEPDIFSQTVSTGNGTPTQDFEPAYNVYDVLAADDFTLPVATSMVSVSVAGTMTSAPPDSFKITIFGDSEGVPGKVVYSELFIDPNFPVSPTFDLSNCPVLKAGTYWLSVQAVSAFGSKGQWFWSTAGDGKGHPWKIQNTAAGFVGGCTSWGDGAGCGFAGASGPGLMFVLHSCLAGVLSDIGPNCRNVSASLDENGYTSIGLTDIVTNFPAAAPAKVTITRSFGTVVYGPAIVYTGNIVFNACHFLNETLTVTVETNGGTCWSNLTFKQLDGPIVESRTQTVYCFDEITRKPDLSNPPLAYIPCQAPFKAKYVTDWFIPYDCQPGVQDTVKVILREWEAYDKKGRRGFAFDTIVVLQFGEIDANHIYCEDRDTLYCSDTTENIGPFITYEDVDLSCDTLWLVTTSDIDNDGMLEFHPAVIDGKCGLDVHVTDHKFKGECGNIYRVTVELKQTCYGPADETCLVDPPAGTTPNVAVQLAPAYWRCEFWLYDLDTLGPDLYCKGDDLFSGPFAVEHWNMIANPNNEPVNGTFFDPENTIDLGAIPYQLKINSYHNPTPIFLGTAKDDNQANFNGLGAYIQNAELSYVAEKHHSFDFGWTFQLDPFENMFPEVNLVPEFYASVSLYISINGMEYPLIEEGDVDPVTMRNLVDEVLLTGSRNGILSIPLNPGDHLTINARWSSPSRATFILYGQSIVSTSEHECSAHSYIPPLYARDDWRGVKQVKAVVETAGSFILSYDQEADCWVSHERVKLPKNGEYYKVVYEAYDSCHNFSSDSCYIYVKDRIKPVPVMDKGLTVSLSDKKVWLDYKAFDEGSYDNCAVNLILIRRADWAEACIDLCDSIQPCFINEHHDTLWLSQLEPNKDIDEVEAHYARTLRWLCEDDTPCGEIIYNAWLYDLMKYATLHCNDHLYGSTESYFKERFAEAYYSSELFRAKFDQCQPEDPNQSTAERFSPFHPDFGNIIDLYEQLGGGWSDAVAFDCTDACSTVTVEMLVMDYWCNWTRVWDQVRVEDKTPAKIVRDVDNDGTISCKSYKDQRYTLPGNSGPVSIEYIVSQAQSGNRDAFEKLDEIFGGYQKAWVDQYGGYVDSDGELIGNAIEFVDSVCVCTDELEKVYVYDEHLGYYWKDSLTTHCYYHPDTLEFIQGIVQVNCLQNVYCEQEIWSDLDHCGQGYLHRKFKIWQSCPDSFYLEPPSYDSLRHPVDTLVRYQRIYIGNECQLNKFMFDVPGDMTIEACGVAYDDKGNVKGDAGPENTGYATYRFDDDCRLVGIAHEDKVFKIVDGEEGCYKILRTWYFADWCGIGGIPVGKRWWEDYSLVLDSCVQKIIVIDKTPPVCTITGPVIDGDTIGMGGCSYDLRLKVRAEDLCGLTHFNWELKNVTGSVKPQDQGQGRLSGNEEEFEILIQGLLPGSYHLRLHLEDECNNESYCEYNFSIKAVKKPSAVCYSSLTARLTPWDRDQDGEIDTAHAVIWASEFDRSSAPTCGDDSLEFRIELLDNTPDDDTPAGDLDSLELGCENIGSRLVRLWVISHPSGTFDYCDVVLIIQSDFTGCIPNNHDEMGSMEKIESGIHHLNRSANISSGNTSGDNIELAGQPVGFGSVWANDFRLEQNKPNPFRSETVIGFVLPQTMEATISLYDLNGKLIRIYSGHFPKGYNQLTVQKNDLPTSAMIFYRLQAGEYSDIKRMLLIE